MTSVERHRINRRILAGACAAALSASGSALAQFVTFSTVAANGYATQDTNSCAIQVNNLTTAGTHQFIGYYDNNRNVIIGRRELGSSTWTTYNSGYTVSAGEIGDDHNIIAVSVDSAGFMHMSWNMHNQSLNYAISSTPVTGASLPSLAFTTQTAVNAPTLLGNGTTGSVTYPQFYNIPNSDNMLFTYRNGSSGSGNQYFNVYSPSSNTWTNNFAIDGNATSVNAYLNHLTYTSTNDLMMSWTWRATPNWQTNSNIMFGQSPDNGTTWFKQGGTTQYTLPIIQSGSPATSVAEVIKNIPQGSSLINQTSMTVDNNDRPYVATYYAPNWDVGTGTGDPNRQYMVVYYDGTTWRTSQVTNRTSDTAIDNSAFAVRDLGRPIVLVDEEDRVLVVTRSQDTGPMGSYATAPDNEIVVYHNTVSSLMSATPNAWQAITLDTANMGSWEPTYDVELWKTQNKLSLFYEPVGLGSGTNTVKVLDWDEVAYFDNPPVINYWNLAGGGSWDTAGNWTFGVPNAAASVANFGNGPIAPTSDSTVSIVGTKTIGTINFNSPAFKYSLVSGGSGALTLNNGALASVINSGSGSHSIAVPISIGSAGVNVTASGGTLTFAGNVTGSGGLTKLGGGTLVLSGTNSYGSSSGATVVSAGALRVTSSASLSSNSNLSINGGILESAVNISRARGTAVGQIQVPGGASGFGAAGADVSFTLTGASISWGTGTFAPSIFVLNSASATNNVTFTNSLSLNGGARTVQVNGALATLSGQITSVGGSLRVEGAGTLVLSNSTNTYGGGTTINFTGQGPATLRAAANNALGTGVVTIAPQGNSTTGRLELIGGISLPNGITFHGRNSSSVAIKNVSGNNTLGGVITLSTGGGNYWVESDAGTLTLATRLTASATGARNVTFQGAGNGVVSGQIENGSATMNLIKAGSGTWTFSHSNNTYTGSTTVSVGKLVLASQLITSPSMTIASGATTELAAGSSVELKTATLTVNGKLDVKDNKVIVTGAGAIGSLVGSTYTGTTGLIASGRNGGAWNGNGIVTTMSAAQGGNLTSVGIARATEVKSQTASVTATWAGQTITGTDTLVMYTYGGDANLDGKINIDDYVRIDSGIAGGLSGWANGDFNYDGKINIDDYTTVIDANIANQGGFVFPTAGGSDGGVVAVPEPGSIAVIALASTLTGATRRRRAV